mmetsp:Transcript_15766/g.26927  ORF Transcript_15766/g.26927 Transcript_15766/m.26927 type:complete len:101 (+) Transcript_15766:170-472(+)
MIRNMCFIRRREYSLLALIIFIGIAVARAKQSPLRRPNNNVDGVELKSNDANNTTSTTHSIFEIFQNEPSIASSFHGSTSYISYMAAHQSVYSARHENDL